MAQATPEPMQEAEPVPDNQVRAPAVFVHWSQRRRQEQMDAFVPEIIRRLSEGETLSAICRTEETIDEQGNQVLRTRERGSFPDRTTFYDWCGFDPAIARQFARAHALGIEALQDQCRAIADDTSRDWIPSAQGLVFDSEHVQRSKLRIWERQQQIARVKGGAGGLLPGESVRAGSKPATLPPAIHVVGIEPKGAHQQPSRDIPGTAVRVQPGGEED